MSRSRASSVSRTRQKQLRFNDDGAFSWNAEYGSNGSATNRRFYLQTPEGSADWPFDGNVSGATGSVFRLEVPTQHQALVSGIAGGERFIMGFGNPRPLATDAAFTGQLDGDLAAGVVPSARAPGLAAGAPRLMASLNGDLERRRRARGTRQTLAACAPPSMAGLTGDLSAGHCARCRLPRPHRSEATFDGGLMTGSLAAGVGLGTSKWSRLKPMLPSLATSLEHWPLASSSSTWRTCSLR